MGDSDEAIKHRSTEIGLSWLNNKGLDNLKRSMIVSGDRDLVPLELKNLNQKYGAVIGDW
jgi:adenosylhomocysteine nucleosidase